MLIFIILNHLLKEYLNDEWDVVTGIPETTPMGLIVLRNRRTGVINIISLSTNQFDAMSHIPGKNYGDLEFYKTFLFVNQFSKELFPSGSDKLGEIIVYNPRNGSSYYRNTLSKFKEYRDLASSQNMSDTITINENTLLGIEDMAMYNLDVNFRNYNGPDKEKINQIFNLFMNTNLNDMDIDKLIEIQNAFFEKFPEYKKKSINPELNFSDDKEMLLALLQVAIVSKSGNEMTGDFKNLSKYSLNFSDFKSLFAALYSHEQSEYDKAGRRIQGLVQGLAWTTPDWVRSNDLRNINKIMSTANSHIGKRMLDESEDLFKLTNKYYDEIGFGEASRSIIGETQSKHEEMWEHKNGKVSDEFRTKNPYAPSTMTKAELDYLKAMLLHINMWKLEIPKAEILKLNPDSLESITKNEKIKKSIEDGSYFEMPLVRREEWTKYKGVVTTPGKLWQDKIKPYVHEINDFLDPRELLQGDLDTIKLQKMGFYEMYDIYGSQTKEYKAKVIEKNGVDYFEFNLDTIAHRIAFNKIRKQTLDRKLPIINSYIWWIKLLGGKQNIDISKQLEYVADQMNLAIYDEPIVDDEFKDLATVTAVLKRMTTAAMLAFRPVLFFKEMTIGVMKGASLAATQIYGKDQFTLANLTEAYKKLTTIDNKFTNEFNLIDRINQYYRFANMDVNTLAKKMQTDRRGLFRGLGRWMYAANTIPDYYNRLSLFLAKMLADGSYNAHSLVDGKFTYDPRKDGRFEYYLANREKHKDKNGNYVPAKGDEKYNKQRQHYLLVMGQLNVEYRGEGVKEMTESDIIPSAYSEKERSSFKSFTDMAYGYYDKDSQSQMNNGFFGMAWLQFMQFWPGKMKMWFAKPTEGKDSPMGKFEQEFTLDKDGNKILMWRKPRLDESGEYMYDESGQMIIDIVEENTGDPSLKWTGTAYEGLAYSLFYTMQDLVRLDFKSIKNNVERKNRVMFALADGALMFILSGLVAAMLNAILADEGTEIDAISGANLKFAASAAKKIHNETNVFNNTLGAIKTEPVFLAWGKRAGGDMLDVLQGDSTITEFLGYNVGATEFLR